MIMSCHLMNTGDCDNSPKVDSTSEVNEENSPVAATNDFGLQM
jgi:hypothetical protein